MVFGFARKLFGSANERLVRNMRPQVAAINALEGAMEALSDEALRQQTVKLREKLTEGATLDSLLPEAFATVREAAKRVLGMRHFDVQLIGGIVLHKGMISEMKTGEGKTLVCTLPAYLNALTGKGVHVVTVNDYLAKRDAGWMGQLYEFLGLSVGCIVHELSDYERKDAYGADITYGTNNEFGFDYLRDNMKYSVTEMVQREFHYAIVDEVDSILVDEARTPLIISGPTEDNSELYLQVDKLVRTLDAQFYEKEEKSRTVTLTDEGSHHIEALLKTDGVIEAESNLYDIQNVSVVHHVNQSLRAHVLFARDVDYIVKDDKVVLIDEFTGRMMEGRRFSEGLHQALEAKEKVSIQNENQTLASITFQNYFRLYPKLAGMTGTAMTEAAEFMDIYKLQVVEVPTNIPVSRQDHDDEIYRTSEEKYEALLKGIEECYQRKQPVLVGTVSIEKSESISKMLKKKKIPHTVLNARYHEKEASIVAQAGRLGAVTIATNMAGRGTDIKLGGNLDMRLEEAFATLKEEKKRATVEKKIIQEIEEEKQKVLEAGGLYVIGTERHESRRIDNQLRGRSGRQGDPGASRFFLSLQDDLMRIFGSEKMDLIMQKMGMQTGEAISHPWMSKALEKAQQKVEGRNYEIRKNLLKFDDVMNDQRKVFYEQRREILQADDLSETVAGMREQVAEELVARCIPERSYAEQWDTEQLTKEVFRIFNLHLPVAEWAKEEGIADQELKQRIQQAVEEKMQDKEQRFTAEILRLAEKRILLHSIDALWKEHLHTLDHLRQGIHLRSYGQRDPLNEYKQEAFALFEHMLTQLREDVTTRLGWLEVRVQSADELEDAPEAFDPTQFRESRRDPADALPANVSPIRSLVRPEDRDPNNPESWGKVNRNDVCPCGSGKKYKHCHGAIVANAGGRV